MGKRQGESVYNINNILIHTSAAKAEKLQYKDIMTPRYGAQSPEDITHTHRHRNVTKKYHLHSWRVTEPSSLSSKEMEDEEGQVGPGA